MKVKVLIAGGLLLAGVGSAVAFATPGNGPPPGKGNPHVATTDTTATDTTAIVTAAAPTSTGGKPPQTGPGCKPAVAVVVTGTASGDASANLDGTGSLSLTVSGGNRWAKLLFGNNTTTDLAVTTDPATQVTSGGQADALSSIKEGDRVLATYQVCQADLAGANVETAKSLSDFLATLTPRKVVELGDGPQD